MSEPRWRRLFRGQTPYEVIELGGKQPPNPPPMPVGAATADPPSPPMSEHADRLEALHRALEALHLARTDNDPEHRDDVLALLGMEYRHVGSFAQHGHDGMGWLGGVDIYVRAEDYDTHVNYSPDAFAIYAENAALRADNERLREALGEICRETETSEDHVYAIACAALANAVLSPTEAEEE